MLSYEARCVDLGSTTLKYHVVNNDVGGTPVLFLHPWFGCWQFWDETVRALPGVRSYLLDLYSLGDGDWQPFAGPEGLGRAIQAFMDTQKIGQCTLVGNSMGGIAAQALAASAPNRFDKLVLIGTGASTDRIKPDFMARLREWVSGTAVSPESDRAAAAVLVGSLLARRPAAEKTWATYVDAVMSANRPYMADMLEQAFVLDLRPRLGAITAEALIIRGARDNARTQEHVQDMLDGIAISSYVEIADAGHSPMVDSTEAFIPLVKDFLAK